MGSGLGRFPRGRVCWKKSATMNVESADLLLYGNPETDADILYFGGFMAPDPFVALRVRGRKVAVLNALEFARGRREGQFDEVLSLEDCLERARRVLRVEQPGIVEVVRLLAKELHASSFHVPASFPAGLAFSLLKAKVKIEVAGPVFFPERAVKSDVEARALRDGCAASAAGIRAAEEALKAAQIKGNRLVLNGQTLTSEKLRQIVDMACLEAGAVAQRTIVAGGDQACDPHGIGEGPLRPNELIIVDVFPRVTATGFFGDMTRTFLKGKASEKQRALVAAVREAQKLALGVLKAGSVGSDVHAQVVAYFEAAGFPTVREGNVFTGFFHGTGHGLGLEIHEAPRINRTGPALPLNSVLTVEPGLYYPGLGGCRIEDVVRLKEDGVEMLSKYHYRWEIA